MAGMGFSDTVFIEINDAYYLSTAESSTLHCRYRIYEHSRASILLVPAFDYCSLDCFSFIVLQNLATCSQRDFGRWGCNLSGTLGKSPREAAWPTRCSLGDSKGP